MDRKTRSFDWERAELIENRPNCYSKHDDEIKLDFTFNQIDDNIFVGNNKIAFNLNWSAHKEL